jgi:hypothetical protein
MIVFTELFRVTDLITNWQFLATAAGYVTFFNYDVIYVMAGLLLGTLSVLSVRVGILSGMGYSVGGLLLTVFDPDFPQFLGNPLGYAVSMEIPVSLLFTLGSMTLVIMLVISIRGLLSLRQAGLSGAA